MTSQRLTKLLLAALFYMLAAAAPVSAAPPTLCRADEEVYFSCLAKTKTISLCGSANATATDGYLIYRYGKAGSVPEFEYPARGSLPPSKAFAFSAWNAPKGGVEQITFTNAKYRYTLYSEHWAGADSREDAGVLVESDGKRVANILCTAPLAPQDMQAIGQDRWEFQKNPKPHYVGMPTGDVRCGAPFRDCY